MFLLKTTVSKWSEYIILKIFEYWMCSVTLDTIHHFNEEFWDRIGRRLTELHFDSCDLSAPVFFAILEYCERIESLELAGLFFY